MRVLERFQPLVLTEPGNLYTSIIAARRLFVRQFWSWIGGSGQTKGDKSGDAL